MSPAGEAVVGLLVALGAVVVLPLGLRLLGPQVVPAPRSAAWPLAGAAAVVSLLLPHSRLAVVLTLPFVLASAVLLGAGIRLAVGTLRDVAPPARPGRAHAVVPCAGLGDVPPRVDLASRAATVTALVLPAVGASALVAERAEWGLLGFSGTYLALTVPHMLYAGFGAALVAGAVARLAPGDRRATAGA
ncbi:YndJ family transporter, partial [Cellulosimicrobium funkei]|uniref:YndJ family transporter n=1 Tax=Cellulosimicrobium funkei TaxID=264251 RepID=UPI003F8F58F9